MKKIIFVIASIVFLMAGMAQADSLQLPSNGQTYTGVTITDPKSSNVSTVAGMLHVNYGPSNQNYQTYDAFCVDPGNIGWNTWYSNYTMIDLPTGNSAAAVAYKQAAYIYGTYGSVNGAIAQLAVWDVVFGGISGTFSVINAGGLNMSTEAAWVLDAKSNYASFDSSSYRLLVSPDAGTQGYYNVDNQDFITRVPEPMSILLLGCGLVGLAGVGRKFKK